ncbi:MAG TPA: penicillin-binding protein [Alphaproteobacteria bacterium]|nr:penicillin-binding protein [Alphaproteobacteria bacterium]
MRVLLYILGGIAIVGLSITAGVALYLFKLSQDLPDETRLANYEPPITTRVFGADGSLIAEYARERRLFVPYEQIPRRVIDAYLAAEDKDFYTHPGVDWQGVARALYVNLQTYIDGANKRPEGASTITQQVAKNFFLTSELAYERKIKEWMLAFRLESAFDKDKILELYLNEIFLGQGSYGVAAAAYNYFDKSLDQLTVAEVAYLAALPKAPSNYHPIRQRTAALERRNWVIEQMLRNDFISQETADAAKSEALVPKFRPVGAQSADSQFFAEQIRRQLQQRYGLKALYDGGLSVRSTFDPRMQNIGVRSLRTGLIAYDRRHGWRGPVTQIELDDEWSAKLKKVPALLDVPEWRLAAVLELNGNDVRIGFANGDTGTIPFAELSWARRHLNDRALGPAITRASMVLKAGDVVYVEPLASAEPLTAPTDRSGEGGSTAAKSGLYTLRQVPKVNGGLVAMDVHTGRVLAHVGGFSYFASEFDRAFQAQRQTGSSFKPIVYAAALDSGYTPSSIVLDAPFVLSQGAGLPVWRPENYSESYAGPSTLRQGLEKSRNLMTIRIANDIGMAKVVDYSKRLGISDRMLPVLANSLGSSESTVFKMTQAYAVFVNGGKQVNATLIDRIQDRHGRTIYRHDGRKCESCNAEGWIEQEEPMLEDNRPAVIDPRTAFQVVHMLRGVVERGTAVIIKSVGVPLAGKTGTTNDFKDAWFVGYSPNLAVGVYVGFDTPAPMGTGETGGQNAAPIFRDFMKAAIGNQPAVPFRIPPGIRMVRVDAYSGRRASFGGAGTLDEAFKAGTEPGSGYVARGDPDRFNYSRSSGEPDDDDGPRERSNTAPSQNGGFDTGLY